MDRQAGVAVMSFAVVVALGILARAADTVDYPPSAPLKVQVLAAKEPDRGDTRRFALPVMIVRGYEAIRFNIEPADPARGSRWVVYDSAQERITVQHADLNEVCGQAAAPGRLGQRVYAAAGITHNVLIGTGPAPGQGEFPGGHVIRDGKDLGAVEAGWAVVRIDDKWSPMPATAKPPRKPGELGCVALARSGDGQRFRLYYVGADSIEYLGLEGGAELERFSAADNHVYFPGADGAVMRKSLVEQKPAEPAAPPRQRGQQAAPPSLPEGSRPDQADYHADSQSWLRHFKDGKAEDLISGAHLQEGYSCFARDGAAANEAAQLFLHRPPAGPPVKLCSLAPFEGQTLSRVYWLKIMGSQDVAVLAGNDRVTVLQVYEAPLLATICAQWNALLNREFQDEPVVKARYLGSLYDQSKYADRGMNPMLLASDGRAYFGTMPHHSSESGQIFCFDPVAEKVSMLGDLDRLAGVQKPDGVPTMLHASGFEMNGKLYFTGQDPHYGGWGFPVEPGQKPPQYYGSPLLEFDLKTRQHRGLGIPLPGHPGVFAIEGDPKRNVLYLRRGYWWDHHGPFTWYVLPLDATGNIAGEPKPLPFAAHPRDILVAADGNVVATVPDKAFFEAADRTRRGETAQPQGAPRCEIVRYRPDTGAVEKLGELEGGWTVDFLPWQEGKTSALGLFAGNLCRLDLTTGAFEKLWPWPKSMSGGASLCFLHGNKVYHMCRVSPKTGLGSRTSVVYTLDLGTGKVLYHGVVVDEAGRRPKDLNYFAVLPDGRIFAAGTFYGLPTDKNYMPRYRDSEPYRLDFGGFLIANLPPGREAPETGR